MSSPDYYMWLQVYHICYQLVFLQVEIPFKAGELVTVYGDIDDDGFYIGEINGVRGLVPSNFLQEVSLAQNAIVTSPDQSESLGTSSPARSDSMPTGPTTPTRQRENISPMPKHSENTLNKVGHSHSFMHVAPSGGSGNSFHW